MVRLLSVALAGVLAQLRRTRDELSWTRRHYAPSDTACEVSRMSQRANGPALTRMRTNAEMTEKIQRNGAPRDML
jgi:hypothetical protein